MQETNGTVMKIFTKFSLNRNIPVMFLTQNSFHEDARTITLNSHYLILFKNPRHATQIAHLGRQMFPSKSKYMLEAFKDATTEPYSYLVVDLPADTDDSIHLLSTNFPRRTKLSLHQQIKLLASHHLTVIDRLSKREHV